MSYKVNVLGGKGLKNEYIGNVIEGKYYVEIHIKGFCDVEVNELNYSLEEFNQKGLKKVLSENGYLLA